MAVSNNMVDDDMIRTLLDLPASRTTFTKTQHAYVDVRKAIVTHSLPGGTPLDEAFLQSQFDVGRTPLREALKRLSHEGLLVWSSHQAPTIRDVGAHEMQHLYETRQILEPTIALLAARRATPADHKRIDHYKDALLEASESGQIYESVEMDFALHAAIAQATGNRYLAESSTFLNLRSLRVWYRNQVAHGISTISSTHSALVDAICDRDERKAETLARQHIANSMSRQATAVRNLLDFD